MTTACLPNTDVLPAPASFSQSGPHACREVTGFDDGLGELEEKEKQKGRGTDTFFCLKCFLCVRALAAEI